MLVWQMILKRRMEVKRKRKKMVRMRRMKSESPLCIVEHRIKFPFPHITFNRFFIYL
jgi:hypothetical protein